MPTKAPQFDELAAAYYMPARIVEQFEALYTESPAVARDLISRLARLVDVPATEGRGAPRPKGASDVNFARVANAIISNAGPLTRDELEARTGVAEHSLHNLLYKTHKAAFRSVEMPGGGRARGYELTPEGEAMHKELEHE